jgi:hypothetical protein
MKHCGQRIVFGGPRISACVSSVCNISFIVHVDNDSFSHRAYELGDQRSIATHPMSDQGLSGGHLVLLSAGEENIALFQCRSHRQKREYILLANIENLATSHLLSSQKRDQHLEPKANELSQNFAINFVQAEADSSE